MATLLERTRRTRFHPSSVAASATDQPLGPKLCVRCGLERSDWERRYSEELSAYHLHCIPSFGIQAVFRAPEHPRFCVTCHLELTPMERLQSEELGGHHEDCLPTYVR
jgi:hypothetical protein